MTIAQQLEQKGIEKGRIEGRMEGRMEGRQEGIQLGEQRGIRAASLKIARAMLQNGFDQNMVMQMTGLTEDEVAQIRY
ncbi:hypothetical protein BFS13_10675 [Pantoea sp. Ae16]|nr:hypothetical protein BFS13_10675 [Pantoea sp. Ae16]